MGCVPAPACKAALEEASRLWPGRSRASDGICGDARHQARKSDHNEGNAFDLTHDPAHGVNCNLLAEHLRARVLSGAETRVKYVIWNRHIFNSSISPDWRPYTGPNPHTTHMHVSILPNKRNDTSPWWAVPTQPALPPATSANPPHSHPTPVLRRGSTGPAVRDLQEHLRQLGYQLTVDSDFGPKTEAAVRDFQRRQNLVVDGVVGPKTWAALHRAVGLGS